MRYRPLGDAVRAGGFAEAVIDGGDARREGRPVYSLLVPESCQSRASQWRDRRGVRMKLAAKACPTSKSERPRSSFRLRASWAMGKLYWSVPPVLEDSSSDFAKV